MHATAHEAHTEAHTRGTNTFRFASGDATLLVLRRRGSPFSFQRYPISPIADSASGLARETEQRAKPYCARHATATLVSAVRVSRRRLPIALSSLCLPSFPIRASTTITLSHRRPEQKGKSMKEKYDASARKSAFMLAWCGRRVPWFHFDSTRVRAVRLAGAETVQLPFEISSNRETTKVLRRSPNESRSGYVCGRHVYVCLCVEWKIIVCV